MKLKAVVQKKGKFLGDLEEAVMEALWDKEAGTVREVLAVVSRKREVAYTTVMTVMTRLVEKGYLKRKELQNGSFSYTPCRNREDFFAAASRLLFSEMIRNAGSVAVAQFVDALEEVDPKQISALKARLKKTA